MKQSHSKVPRRLVSCGLATSTKDYHARLVVHGLPRMTKPQIRRLIRWLENTAFNLKIDDKKRYSQVWTAKLMK